DPTWGFSGNPDFIYAQFIPLPPSSSGYSSPLSQRVPTRSSVGSRSSSRTLSPPPIAPTKDAYLGTSYPVDNSGSPYFEQSPFSNIPAVGTPLVSSTDLRSPFSPRPETPALFAPSQQANGASHSDQESITSAKSPETNSPVIKLPEYDASSMSSSGWSTLSAEAELMSPKSETSLSQRPTDLVVPVLRLQVPPTNGTSQTVSVSASPSSISPESAGIDISANVTPDYLREARAYLAVTHPTQTSSNGDHSPALASPSLSSIGLTASSRGRRREVRFEDSIMSEPMWDNQSTESSDSSFDPPVMQNRRKYGIPKRLGTSKLPRFAPLRPGRGTGRLNGSIHSSSTNGTCSLSPYHCRICRRDTCEDLTTTTCGHLFCNACITDAVIRDSRCPHTNSKHSVEYECTYCDRTFKSEAGRDQHEEAKHPEYECSYCDRTFKTEAGRDQHEEVKHPEYECSYCDRTFKTEAGRDQHEEAKHPDYECSCCDHTFKTAAGRDQHEREKHPEYDCPHCDLTYTTPERRDQHQRTKHRFRCILCDRNFLSEGALEQHDEEVHPVYECRYCDEDFSSEQSCAQHQTTMHPALRSTICSSSYQLRDSVTSRESTPVPSGDYSNAPHDEDSDASDDNSDALSDDHSDAPSDDQSEASSDYHSEAPSDDQSEASSDYHSEAPSDHHSDVSITLPNEQVTVPKPVANFACETCTEHFATMLSVDLPGAIEPEAVEDSLIESREPVDPLVDGRCNIAEDTMALQHEQTLLGVEREVDGELSFSLTPAPLASPPGYKDDGLDSPTLMEDDITLQSCAVRPEYGSIPCDMDMLEHCVTGAASIDPHLVMQNLIAHERTFSKLEILIDSHLKTRDHSMAPAEASDDQQTILDAVMNHQQTDNLFVPHVPGLEHDNASSLRSAESLASDTLSSVDSVSTQGHSPQCITSPQVYAAELESRADLDNLCTRDLVPSPTPSEHGSLRPASITQGSHVVGSRPPSPSTSGGSTDDFPDADPASTPSSPLSERSIVFVSAESIPEYLRENHAYLVATSAPSRPSSAASSYIRLPSVASLDSILPQEEPDLLEASLAGSPPTNGPSRLHCRICLQDPCDDLTATMCGHVFCNRCIIDAVMTRSACPVCNAPTLLYCLFRLDI
ncbi:hypothetical protein AZE42_10232, partial [Rhizopogon vesiculosus]